MTDIEKELMVWLIEKCRRGSLFQGDFFGEEKESAGVVPKMITIKFASSKDVDMRFLNMGHRLGNDRKTNHIELLECGNSFQSLDKDIKEAFIYRFNFLLKDFFEKEDKLFWGFKAEENLGGIDHEGWMTDVRGHCFLGQVEYDKENKVFSGNVSSVKEIESFS